MKRLPIYFYLTAQTHTMPVGFEPYNGATVIVVAPILLHKAWTSHSRYVTGVTNGLWPQPFDHEGMQPKGHFFLTGFIAARYSKIICFPHLAIERRDVTI